MKGTKQWNTTSKWKRLCHNAGQSILKTLKFGEGSVHDTIQKEIAIIETTKHKSSCKNCCTIQIKVRVNMTQILYEIKHELQTIDLCEWKVKYFSNITPRCQADFTELVLKQKSQ